MGNLRFLLLALLGVGVAQIQGRVDIEHPLEDLPEIAPTIPLEKAPKAQLPSEPLDRSGFKGQLLHPEDGCGISKTGAGRIVGGTPTKPGAYPWMALIGYLSGSSVSFNCGGSLITSRHVLTAAHCINSALYLARLGEHDVNDFYDGEHEDVRVIRTYPHAQYDKRLMINDIAILHLNRDVKTTDRVRPICIPISSSVRHQSFVGKTPFVAGWGTTRENGRQSSVLLHTQVPVITNNDCRQKYSAIGAVQSASQFSHYVICAGHRFGGQDSCQGDSGGPLMLPIHEKGKFPFYQIGVVSYGIGCARANIPGVYANVPHYVDWIQTHLY